MWTTPAGPQGATRTGPSPPTTRAGRATAARIGHSPRARSLDRTSHRPRPRTGGPGRCRHRKGHRRKGRRRRRGPSLAGQVRPRAGQDLPQADPGPRRGGRDRPRAGQVLTLPAPRPRRGGRDRPAGRTAARSPPHRRRRLRSTQGPRAARASRRTVTSRPRRTTTPRRRRRTTTRRASPIPGRATATGRRGALPWPTLPAGRGPLSLIPAPRSCSSAQARRPG